MSSYLEQDDLSHPAAAGQSDPRHLLHSAHPAASGHNSAKNNIFCLLLKTFQEVFEIIFFSLLM
jgi:hypothetical protein